MSASPSMSSPDDACSQQLVAHALLLLARVSGGDSAASQRAQSTLDAWVNQHPQHKIAFDRAQHIWGAQYTLAASLKDRIAEPLAVRSSARRASLRTLAGLGIVTMLGNLLRSPDLQPLAVQRIQTQGRESTDVLLADGTQAVLDADTRATVKYYRDRRIVSLASGRIYFDVAHDAGRPFFCETSWGRLQVVGTAFNVMVVNNAMDVQVLRGRVRVWPVDRPQAGVLLHAGDAVRTNGISVEQMAQSDPDQMAAWRQGWLVFDGTTLDDALALWRGWLHTPVRLEDRTYLSRLRLTGSFNRNDPDRFLRTLPAVLPVRVTQAEGGISVIAPLRKK